MKCKFVSSIQCHKTQCLVCSIFEKVGQQILDKPPEETTVITITYHHKKFICPYCLYSAPLTEFLIKIKSGFSEKRFRCPDCDSILRRQTLFEVQDMTYKQFSEWILETGAWKRIIFQKFSRRLRLSGEAPLFWSTYRRAKEELTTPDYEDYEDYIMRKQEEMKT